MDETLSSITPSKKKRSVKAQTKKASKKSDAKIDD